MIFITSFTQPCNIRKALFCKRKRSTLIYNAINKYVSVVYRLKTLLTDKIGVPANVEHELPWHPPTCPNDKEAATFTQKKSQK